MGISFIRTIILYLFLIIAIRIMGKRQIGELQPSELAVTILISELAAIPMQETGIPLVSGLVPIFTLAAANICLSFVVLKSRKLRMLLTGKPSVLIRNGIIDQKEMKKQGFNIDDLMEELRLCGYATLDEVSYAICETNGKLSVFPNSDNKPVTAMMLNLHPQDNGMPITIIADGCLGLASLKAAGKNLTWLEKTVKAKGLRIEDVFIMTIDKKGKSMIVPKENEK